MWLQYMLQSYATASYYRNMNCRDLFKNFGTELAMKFAMEYPTLGSGG